MNGGRKSIDSLEQKDKTNCKGKQDHKGGEISEIDMKLRVDNLLRHYLQDNK